jgi:hypothetical protein
MNIREIVISEKSVRGKINLGYPIFRNSNSAIEFEVWLLD